MSNKTKHPWTSVLNCVIKLGFNYYDTGPSWCLSVLEWLTSVCLSVPAVQAGPSTAQQVKTGRHTAAGSANQHLLFIGRFSLIPLLPRSAVC